MDLTVSEVLNSVKVEREKLFPTSRGLSFLALALVCGVLAHFEYISSTTATLLVLLDFSHEVFVVLRGIFDQLEWLRYEAVFQRESTGKSLERIYDLVQDKNV